MDAVAFFVIALFVCSFLAFVGTVMVVNGLKLLRMTPAERRRLRELELKDRLPGDW